MNFAFPALLILLLSLPGIALRFFYARGQFRWNSPVTFRPIADEIGYSLVYAGILHFLWTMIVSLLGYRVNLEAVLVLIIGSFGKDDLHFDAAIRSFIDYPVEVTVYFITLTVFSVIVGYLGHQFVRWSKLDRKTRFWRFRNEWFYLFTGEILDFAEMKDKFEVGHANVDYVYVSAIVEYNKIVYLYRGVLDDFFFNSDGTLDRIVLRFATRRRLEDDRDKEKSRTEEDIESRYYVIEGEFFVLKYSEIKNINIEYAYIKEVIAGIADPAQVEAERKSG